MEGQHFPRVADEEILSEIAADGGRGAVLAEPFESEAAVTGGEQ